MTLSCSCDSDDDCDWYCTYPCDYSTLDTKRGRRCSSCKTIIKTGLITAKFERERRAKTDIEERIYGDGCDVPMPSLFLCEQCADLYFSLMELGFECVSPEENMRDLVKEYAEIYGPQPTRNGGVKQ